MANPLRWRAAPLWATTLLLACGGGSGREEGVRTEPPAPSESRLAELDPELADAIRAACDAVRSAPGEAAPWMRLGLTYEAHVLHGLALACYEQAVARDARDPRAWYRLALARDRDGDPHGAAAAFERTLALAPDYAPARLRLGRTWLDAGEVARAGEVFQAVLEREPGQAAAVQGLAEVRLEGGDPEGALALLADPGLATGAHAALTQRLRGTALARLGRDEQAREALARGVGARVVVNDPWSREVAEHKVGVSARLMRAAKLVDRGRLAAALELLEPLRGQAADDPRVWRQLGVTYGRAERWADAAQALGRARALEPGDDQLLLSLAAALRAAGREEEALRELEPALAASPADADLRAACQDLALAAGRFERAIALRDEAPGTRAALEVGAGKAELELARLTAAAASFTRALELDDQHPEAWVGRALVLLEQGRPADAAGCVARVADLAPGHPMLAALRARLEQDDGGGDG